VTTEEVDQLAAYIRGQLSNRIYDLRLRIRGNGIVLQGRCPSYHLKQLAQELVKRVTDVPVSANDIEVIAAPRRSRPAKKRLFRAGQRED
jgi:hypothetical protein